MKRSFNSVLLILATCTGLIFTSCKDDSAIDIKLSAPSAAKFKDLQLQALKDLTQTKSFKAQDGITFTSNKGAIVKITPNCLHDESNNLVTGDVSLSFVEMYDRGDMVTTNKPVMGRNNNGDRTPLVTGGHFNLQVFQGDKELRSGCPFSVSLKASHTGGLDNAMILWKGQIDEEDNLIWDEAGRDGQKNSLNPNAQNAQYDIFSNTFGWTNVDRFYNDPRPKTQIKVSVPSNYNHTNSGVYLAYEGENNVLAQLDIYDSVDKYFTEHYGFVPVGLKLHVIFVSESNGSIVYAIKSSTIAANATINISESELNTTTKAQLVNMINNLN